MAKLKRKSVGQRKKQIKIIKRNRRKMKSQKKKERKYIQEKRLTEAQKEKDREFSRKKRESESQKEKEKEYIRKKRMKPGFLEKERLKRCQIRQSRKDMNDLLNKIRCKRQNLDYKEIIQRKKRELERLRKKG